MPPTSNTRPLSSSVAVAPTLPGRGRHPAICASACASEVLKLEFWIARAPHARGDYGLGLAAPRRPAPTSKKIPRRRLLSVQWGAFAQTEMNSLPPPSSHPTTFQEIKDGLRKLYLEDPRPWLVGFSGGKDSTVLASLIFDVVLSIPAERRKKEVAVVCTDTRVEIPAIAEMIEGTLDRMRRCPLALGASPRGRAKTEVNIDSGRSDPWPKSR